MAARKERRSSCCRSARSGLSGARYSKRRTPRPGYRHRSARSGRRSRPASRLPRPLRSGLADQLARQARRDRLPHVSSVGILSRVCRSARLDHRRQRLAGLVLREIDGQHVAPNSSINSSNSSSIESPMSKRCRRSASLESLESRLRRNMRTDASVTDWLASGSPTRASMRARAWNSRGWRHQRDCGPYNYPPSRIRNGAMHYTGSPSQYSSGR